MRKLLFALLAASGLGACGMIGPSNQTPPPVPVPAAAATPWSSGNTPIPRDGSFRPGYGGGSN